MPPTRPSASYANSVQRVAWRPRPRRFKRSARQGSTPCVVVGPCYQRSPGISSGSHNLTTTISAHMTCQILRPRHAYDGFLVARPWPDCRAGLWPRKHCYRMIADKHPGEMMRTSLPGGVRYVIYDMIPWRYFLEMTSILGSVHAPGRLEK